MSELDGTQATALQRPLNGDKQTWKAYWEERGQPWRTEPEIDIERQNYLTGRRAIKPDVEKGIYPFKDIEPKLTRADIEWLLATHENGRGSVNISEKSEWSRKGLDMRGANLSQVDLERLPLAAMNSGLTRDDRLQATPEQREAAAVILDGAHLGLAHLENARLTDAYLRETDFRNAYLHDTIFNHAHLAGASFHFAYLEATHFESAILCDKDYGGPHMADVRWGNVNLSVVKWTQLDMLGDEYKARQKKQDGKVKDNVSRLEEYEAAVRANRQLAVTLQSQGLNESAAYFAYRAQKLQRVVLRRQKKFLSYIFSFFLDLLAGYGYRPGRSVIWYMITIFGFALAYTIFGHLPYLPDALVFSLTSFHGRGFFPGLGSENSLHNPLVIMAAFEAVVGLFIEISFIATFTQRFFGK